MLFYAIYLRIHQYDITVNRYFVVVFGLWLLVISAYYIFSNKKHLAFIPAVLTLFTVIISVGPWGVYSLPESRQLERLKSNLISANILKD
jgi:flagellar biosynthesis protein FliQ